MGIRFVETAESRAATKAKRYFVWRVRPDGRRGRWYSWRVESPEAARAMVAWWRDREPSEYPLADRWAVTLGEDGEQVDTFTTKEAVG